MIASFTTPLTTSMVQIPAITTPIYTPYTHSHTHTHTHTHTHIHTHTHSLTHQHPQGLLRHFRANITGFALFDPTTNSTNAAVIHSAGAAGGVVAVGKGTSTASFLADTLKVPKEADVSASSPFQAFTRSKAGLSNRMAVFQPDDGGKAACLSAYVGGQTKKRRRGVTERCASFFRLPSLLPSPFFLLPFIPPY